MSSLVGKLVSETEVTSSPDILFDIFAHKPYQLLDGAPDIITSFDLLDGLWGTLGSIVSATYIDGGVTKMVKGTMVAIDEGNKSVTYMIIEGDLLNLYSTISITFRAGTQDGKNLVAWTLDYLKLLPTSPDPTSLINLAVALIKEIDAQNLK